MKIFTKLGIAFLLTLFATGVLFAQNPEANIASKILTDDNSVNVIGDRELPDAEVIATGVPMSKDEIKSLNIKKQINNDKGTDEIDIIGGTGNSYNSGPRTRGNAFYCSEEKILVEFMGWHAVSSDPTQMWMVIYECDVAIGTYDLVSATDISPAPIGTGWVSSGVIDFPLVVGKYYMLLASFEQACGYYCDTDITPFPVPVAFGEAIGGVGFSWTPQSEFPPAATMTPGAGAWDAPTLYHQQLVTEDPISNDNDMGIESIISPASATGLSATESVTVDIKNYGANAQTGFEVSYTLDGGTTVVETVTETINSGETLEHTFATTVDLSTIGVYELEACTVLTGDESPDNDCIMESVEHIPPSYCDASTTLEDEYIANVLCGTIDNSTGWQVGVADYTAISTTISAGAMEEITVSSNTTYAADEVYAWVDWNNDFEFEIGGDEEFALINDGTGAVYTSNIVVPANTPIGDHRMRIRMVYGSTPEPCENLAYGEIEDYTIEVVESTFGTLNGTITAEGGTAIEDATITVAGMTTTSGADGTYSFTDVFTGAQNVSCSADGYISETETLVIEEGQTATLDFELVQAEFGNLEGTVTSDGGSAIEGAIISIAEMTTTSEADGSYSIMNILVGTYTVSCTADDYSPGSETVEIENGQTTTLDFDLVALGLLPPSNFTAAVVNGNDVELNWVAPGGLGYMQWDNGINEGYGLGIGNGGIFSVASRWTPSELEIYAGKIMTSITFFPNNDANATFVLKAWVGENAAMEIMSQEVTSYNNNEFNEIALTSPIVIDDSKELWFGYEVSHLGGTYPAGADPGPAVQGSGDMISMNGPWVSLMIGYGLDHNWNLAAYIAEADGTGKFVNKPMVKTIINNPSTGDQLVASGENGPTVKMDKKADKSFLGFNVYQDGNLIAEEIINANFSIFDLLPGTYSFDVKSVYDEGLSAGAGPVEATILEGVDRDLVIIEVATGTWCQYCPGAAMAVDEMHEEGLSVGIIEYHTGDDYETTEAAARIAYYAITSYPTAVFDGVISYGGGSATQSLYTTYLPKYESRIEIPSLFEIEAEYINVSETNFQVSIEAEMINTYPLLTNDIVLQVALTESHIPESWQNQTELNFVLRDMIPDENGTELDFTESATHSVTLDFTIPSNYVMDNLELVVYIQDITTKEILQGTMAWLITGIEDVISENEMAVYPNPAADIVNITADNNIKSITVYNNVGQVITVEIVENTNYIINSSDYEAGIYYLHMDTDNGVVTKRIVVK